MVEELIRKLLESGVHFGHQTQRWNPKMKRFIFGERSGIYIIDLEKTADTLTQARDFAKSLASQGKNILFVGTKKQAQMIIQDESKRCNMFYVTHRWLGGLLTNFETVKKSIKRLDQIEKMAAEGLWENLKKKEIAVLNKEKEKLLKDLGGIREMRQLPDAVFIVDPKREDIATREANKLGIPIIAIVDTNCDPDVIDYPIPGNDDALKSIRFITSLIADSVAEGRKDFIAAKPSVDTGETVPQDQAQIDKAVDSESGEQKKSESAPAAQEKPAPKAPAEGSASS